MILHIVPDDKFIDMAYNIFEKVSPHNNEFMVVTEQKDFKYIKNTPITKISLSDFLSRKFAKNLQKYEFVVLHWLDNNKITLIKNAPKHVKFLWIGWGGDYYSYINKNLLFSRTSNLKARNHNKRKFYGKNLLRSLKNSVKGKSKNYYYKKVINRINYFAPVLYEDYVLVKQKLKTSTPSYLDWNYGTLEDDLIGDIDIQINGENILLGNSATYENNHIEAIELLKNLDLNERKIICPLSYGNGGKSYVDFITSYGEKELGENFEPLVRFMKTDEYYKLISTCSIVIMNNIRQQALGNIITMMYFGAKVYLNKQNPVYDFLINNGAVVFSMEELNNDTINIKFTADEIETNRKVLRKYWGREVMIEKTKALIDTMNKDM